MLKFEPAEVLEVFTDTFDEPLINAVRARYLISSQGQTFNEVSIFLNNSVNLIKLHPF